MIRTFTSRVVCAWCVTALLAGGAIADSPRLSPLRERAAVRDAWLAHRLETIIPPLLRRVGVDMWIISAREYNEDPVIATMLPAEWLGTARRRTILVFFDRGVEAGVERLSVARYNIGGLFAPAWNPEDEPDQWRALAAIVRERDPRRIAVNVSTVTAFADGLTAAERDAMLDALGPGYGRRVMSDDALAVGWLETRSAPELEAYPHVSRVAHAIIDEALSDRVIQPGVTTTKDVEWWCRERVAELKLMTWFHPSVSVQRAESETGFVDLFEGQDAVIRPGDLVHIDFGIVYLGLHTDTQRMAYVLRPGEAGPPAGLTRAFAVGNELQDVLTSQFRAGRTGNEILAGALAEARRRGIDATIYTHPLGLHGHAAGPLIGLWDQQGGVPGRGDFPLNPNTAHSIELNARVAIPEWGGQHVRIMLEEDAIFDGQAVRYIAGRQSALMTIPRRP